MTEKIIGCAIEVHKILSPKKGAEQKAIQMAKVLKKKGVDVKLIAVASGLSIRQVQKL